MVTSSLRPVLIVLALFLFECGYDGGETTMDEVRVRLDSDSTVILAIKDSIGSGSGDPDYMMGAVEGAVYGPDGNIAVLDCALGSVRIYSPHGEYLRSIGQRGIGPGELGNVTFMAITEEGEVLLSGIGGEECGVHRFDYYNGEWLSSEHTFIPPSCLESAWSNEYVRKDITYEIRDDDIWLPVTVSLYSAGEPEPLVTFYGDTVLFDPSKEVELLELDWNGFDIAADPEGNVFIAPRSTREGRVLVYDSLGTLLRTLELPYQPVERTPEEMNMERNILRARAIASNENPEGLEPNPYKPTIRGLEVDAQGNLWILQGGPSTPTFSVVTPEGRHLYEAVVAGDHTDGSSWQFHVCEDGILAYAEDPECGFQKVFLLEPVQQHSHTGTI